VFQKIKKEIGEFKDIHGLAVFVFNRIRMYTSLFGISFLVLERFFAIMGVDLGITEYLISLPTWTIYLGIAGGLLFGAMWMYIDLKFIIPSERRSSTKRDPIIGEIRKGIKDIRKEINDLRSDSKLQQWRPITRLTEAIGKPFPKDGGSG